MLTICLQFENPREKQNQGKFLRVYASSLNLFLLSKSSTTQKNLSRDRKLLSSTSFTPPFFFFLSTPQWPLSDDNTLFAFCPISAPCLHSIVTQLPWKCQEAFEFGLFHSAKSPELLRGSKKFKAKNPTVLIQRTFS